MNTPARILRATIENRHKRPEPTARELEREDRFVVGAQTAFAEHGRNHATLRCCRRRARIGRARRRWLARCRSACDFCRFAVRLHRGPSYPVGSQVRPNFFTFHLTRTLRHTVG